MIVIVGGGLVGLSLALALAPLNLPIKIIEKHPQAGKDAAVRSIALAHGAMMVYKSLGLESALNPLVSPITKVHVSSHQKFAKTYIEAKEQGLTALGYVINVAKLRQVLWQALTAYSHIELLAPQEVMHMDAKAKGWQLTLLNDLTLAAKLVIVADGQDSGVAKQLGIKTESKAYQQYALVGNMTTTVPPQGIAYERFTKEGPIALLPQSDGTMALVWALAAHQKDNWQQASTRELIEKLQPLISGQVGRIKDISATMLYPLALRQIETPTLPHLLFLGNAARTMHPIAAQGFNLAMRDIAHLVDAMAHTNDVNEIGQISWLENFWQTRVNDEKRTLQFTDKLIETFHADYFPMTCLRLMGLQSLQLSPTLKRLFGLYTTGNLGHLPTLMRGATPW